MKGHNEETEKGEKEEIRNTCNTCGNKKKFHFLLDFKRV